MKYNAERRMTDFANHSSFCFEVFEHQLLYRFNVLEGCIEFIAQHRQVIVEFYPPSETSIWVTNKKPNSFINPPNFALPSFLTFLILPLYSCVPAVASVSYRRRAAIILGRIAFARPKRTLCLQRISKIASELHCFFVTLPRKSNMI